VNRRRKRTIDEFIRNRKDCVDKHQQGLTPASQRPKPPRARKMACLTGSEYLERLDGHASVAERAEFFGCKRRRFAEAAPGVEEAGH
jgi:hypothetical protein